MVMPPVPQLPAQHPSAPFCQMTWAVGVGVGLDDVLLEQEDRKAAPVAKRPATTPDIRNFIILSEGDSLANCFKQTLDERDAADATPAARVSRLRHSRVQSSVEIGRPDRLRIDAVAVAKPIPPAASGALHQCFPRPKP